MTDTQIGGTHYLDMSVQPFDAMERFRGKQALIDSLCCKIHKYFGRNKHADDVEKGYHCLAKLIEVASDGKYH